MSRLSIGIDGSGNTGQGLGTTGITKIIDPQQPELVFIVAKPYEMEEEYFNRVIRAIETIYNGVSKEAVVILGIEKYIDYGQGFTRFTESPTIRLNKEIELWAKNKSNIIIITN